MPIFPIAHIINPRHSRIPTFFDMYSQKNILQKYSNYLIYAVLDSYAIDTSIFLLHNYKAKDLRTYNAFLGHDFSTLR